jgi:hypothetical protein
MELDILLTIFGVSIIQSLFGVGVLLFGTPLLLLLDYPFLESLLILLPISASINVMQVAKDYQDVELTIYRNILLFTIPCIVLFLVLVSKSTFNMNLLIGILILLVAMKEHSQMLQTGLSKLLEFNKLFYATMGVIHGMTNLGGVLLAAKVFHTPLNKHQKRVTIALSYMTFALFQIVTILALDMEYHPKNIGYIGVGLAVYFGVNKFLFHKISEGKYNTLLSGFLALTGLLLVGKGMQWSFG